MRDFDENGFPPAYVITFRCYGTWLHGDSRGSYRRNSRLLSGVSKIPPRLALRAKGFLSAQVKPWARHGSTIYLWKERDVERAVEYVLLGQDHEFKLD